MVSESGSNTGNSRSKRPPFTTVTVEKSIRWRDVKDLVFEAIEYGAPTDFEAKKLAQISLKLLGEKQSKASVNLSFYSAVAQSLDFLSDDELRRLALRCINKCTDSEENCHNITSIAQKVGAINTRYFDFKYRGKPYITKKPLTIAEQEVAVANLSGVNSDEIVDETSDRVFDISKALGYVPYQD